jgi:hypothetical protein
LGTQTATVGAWTQETFTVTATSTSEAVRFQAINTGIGAGLGNEITNVSLTAAVPEPSTWAMMLSGFAGLAFLGYRQRKSAAAAA